MRSLYNKKKFLIALFSFMLFVSIIFSALSLARISSANSMVTPTLYAPSSNAQLYALTEPTDAYYYEGSYALVDQNATKLVYYDGVKQSFSTIETGLVNISQVSFLDDSTILVQGLENTPIIKKVDLSNDQAPVITSLGFGGTYFAVYGNDIVVAYDNQLTRYTYNGTSYDKTTLKTDASNHAVSINANGDVFYVNSSNKVVKTNLDAANNVEIADKAPIALVSNQNSLYYILKEGENFYLYVTDLLDANLTKQKLLFPSSDFDLGKLVTPASLRFKGENLLIADKSLNAVQEFEICEDENQNSFLQFTGFAIAKDKSAFNRISTSQKEIERNNKTYAVLDDNKILVANGSGEKTVYTNYLFGETTSTPPLTKNTYFFENATPESFALGNGSILFYKNGTSASTSVAVLDFATNQILSVGGLTGASVKDVCFINDNYYILERGNDTSVTVYQLTEGSSSATKLVGGLTSLSDSVKFAVDVYGNIFATGSDFVKAYYKTTDGYNEQVTTLTSQKIVKLHTDLNGSLFALYSDGIVAKYYAQTVTEYTLANAQVNAENCLATSFALDNINDSVNFIYNGYEFIFESYQLPVASLKSMDVVENFVTTGSFADISNLKFYKINQNSNGYIVNVGENDFDYAGLQLTNDIVYTKVGSLDCQGEEYILLASKIMAYDENTKKDTEKDQTIVINTKCLTDKTAEIVLDATTPTAYVTTDVNMYYLPLITLNAEYSLTDGSVVRLSKETPISTLKEFTFCGREFYYAQAIIGGNGYTGYVPKSFTTEILYKDDVNREFTLQKVISTKVYLDPQLSVEIFSLNLNDEIRVYEIVDGVAEIAFTDGNDNLVKGYISSSSIIVTPNTMIRNMIIVLCVLVSLTVTSLFFVLRKKS